MIENNSTEVQVPKIDDTETAPIITENVSVIDLFSGAGGFSLGALRAGADVIGALEYNISAAKTYSDNIRRKEGSPVPIITESILTISPSDAMETWGVKKGTCDIVIGGPPCQGFSTHRRLDSGVNDPRNELLCRYFEYVDALRPRIFLVENVPGILWERHASYLLRFRTMAEAAGYELRDPVILNARDYGVPQNRKRVFLLGIDSERPVDIHWPPHPTHFAPVIDSLEVTSKSWVKASDVFKPVKEDDVNNVHMNHSAELISQFASTPKNGGSRHESNRTLKCHVGHSGHKDVYGRIDPSKPGPTMTTACINPSKGRFVHPTANHGITLRHAARFQSFPDSFVFSGGLMAAGTQIGNAVPVALAEVLIQVLSEALKESL